MLFSIITPSYKQLDWLRLCVASVRDQVVEKAESGNLKAEEVGNRNFQVSGFKFQPSSTLCVEHLIQDAGTPGIEDFAREINADFYRDGRLVFEAVASDEWRVASESSSSSSDSPPATRHPAPSPRPYRIAIYCERDAGMYDAINRGLERAGGDLCAYLNCDEQYLPNALREVVNWFAQNPDKEVVFADAILLKENGRALSYRRTVLPDRWHTRLCHLNTLTCSTFFKRRVFEAGHRFPTDKKVIGDGIWVDGMLAARVPMGYLPKPTSVYSFTGVNLSDLDQGEQSEQSRWGREVGAPPSWLKLPVMILHRLKKFLAGAYRKRTLHYAILVQENPETRKEFTVNDVGGGWPGQTA